MTHQSPCAHFMTVGCLWIARALVSTSRDVTAQASATMLAIEGAATTYQSIDRDGKPVRCGSLRNRPQTFGARMRRGT